MFWTEDSGKKEEYRVPTDIVDMSFSINCKMLPLEHAHELSVALLASLPWVKEEADAGIHLIHGAADGNGWFRPDSAASDELLHLSRRTKLRLRLPHHRLEDAQALTGITLDIAGYTLEVGKAEVKELSPLPTQFCRYVAMPEELDESAFLKLAAEEIAAMGIQIRKMMAGKAHQIRLPDMNIPTRSLMIADLEPEEAVLLQQRGIGPHRLHGCGLFIPQKGIKPVKQD